MTVPTPLLHRFRSALWGATVAGSWGLADRDRTGSDLQSYLVQVSTRSEPGFERLVQQVRQQIQAQCQNSPYRLTPSNHQPPDDKITLMAKPEGMVDLWLQVLITTLLYHQSLPQLLHQIQSIQAVDTHSASLAEPKLSLHLSHQVIGSYFCQRILLSDPIADTILPSAMDAIAEVQDDPDLMSGLRWVEQAWVNQFTVQHLVSQLSTQPLSTTTQAIAIAWYCFYTTPQDFVLSVTRAVKFSPQPILSGLLAGSWSSLYNGKVMLGSGLGNAQVVPGDREYLTHTSISVGMQVLFQSATELFALWSGVLSTPDLGLDDGSALKITTPRSLLYF